MSLPSFSFPKLPSFISPRHTGFLLVGYSIMTLVIISVAVIKHKPVEPFVFASANLSSSLPPQEPLPDIPILSSASPPPFTTAQSVLVIDAVSGTVLYQYQPDLVSPPASLTKIMTALVALDTYSLNQVITITKEENTKGQTMNLKNGEQITVKNLLYGMMVGSGNDAALALALAYPRGGYTGFVSAMNQKAKTLGLSRTSFKNVSGVDSYGHLSTASDFATLTLHALKNPLFRSLVATKQTTVSSVDDRYQHLLYNTNELLGNLSGVDGVKTGWTETAGQCLVTHTTRNNRQILTVVFNSQDRFGDSTELIEWIYANTTWIPVTENPDDLPLN